MTPWGGRLGRIQTVTTAVGAVLILAGWWGASGSGGAGDQINWVALAAAGAIVAGFGHGVFLLDAHRRVTACRLAVIGGASDVPASLIAAPVSTVHTGAGVLVAVPGARRHHRADCHLVSGKAVAAVRSGAGGSLPCEVCCGGPS